MKKDKLIIPISNIYRRLIIIYIALLIVGNTFHFEPSYFIVLVLSILTVFFTRKEVNKKDIHNYIFISGYLLYGIVVALFTKGGIGGPFSIITGLIVFFAAQKLVFNKTDIIIVVLSSMVSIVYWVVRSPTYYQEFFYNQWKGDHTFTNSNGVALYLMCECIFVFIIIDNQKHKFLQHVKWLLVGVCLWAAFNVKSRMVFLTFVLYFIANAIILGSKKNKQRLLKLFLYSSIALEIIFPLFYLFLFKIGFGKSIKFFGLNEKGLYSGRELIWSQAFDNMTSIADYMFGIGSRHDFWKEGILNMHNNAMNLFVVVGVIGLVVYFVFIIDLIINQFDYNNASKMQWQFLIYFICIIFEGVTDVTLFYNPLVAFYFIPLGIALNKKYNKLDYEGVKSTENRNRYFVR